MRRRERERLARRVRAEFVPGGRPIRVYLDLGLGSKLSASEGIALTNEVLANLEERLVRLERLNEEDLAA